MMAAMIAAIGEYILRQARPSDYEAIAAVVDEWWGREILPLLSRLFLDHFYRTSLIAEGPDGLGGFLIGILSPSEADRAYIHFVGVAPRARRHGLAGTMYERFFQLARAEGRQTVKAITSPANRVSIDFHRRMGFTVTGPVADYDGPGRDKVVFNREI